MRPTYIPWKMSENKRSLYCFGLESYESTVTRFLQNIGFIFWNRCFLKRNRSEWGNRPNRLLNSIILREKFQKKKHTDVKSITRNDACFWKQSFDRTRTDETHRFSDAKVATKCGQNYQIGQCEIHERTFGTITTHIQRPYSDNSG